MFFLDPETQRYVFHYTWLIFNRCFWLGFIPVIPLFLVDMSNSTAGWVNNALKESLVLMAEAMEILGDRYGIENLTN